MRVHLKSYWRGAAGPDALARRPLVMRHGSDVRTRYCNLAGWASFKFRTDAKWPMLAATYRSVGLGWPGRKLDWAKGGRNRRNQQCPVFSKHLWPLASWQPYLHARRQPMKSSWSIRATLWSHPNQYTTASFKLYNSAPDKIRCLPAACHTMGDRQGAPAQQKLQRSL